jgi:hypothetical protein
VSAYEGDAAAVGKLIRHWGDGYVISYANGLYHAERRDNGAQVHAPGGPRHTAGAPGGSCLAAALAGIGAVTRGPRLGRPLSGAAPCPAPEGHGPWPSSASRA